MALLSYVLVLIQQASPTTAPPAAESFDPLRFWVQIGSIAGAVITLLTFFFTRTLPWIKARRDRRSIQNRIGAESYTRESLENAFCNFIPPTCQDVDPSGGDEPRNVYGVKQPLFSALDDALSHPEVDKYFILLADSGMGKTTALLNYYLRHIRRRRKPAYKLALVPLNIEDADARIEAIPNKEDTVLFLDALDEDTLAIVDYVERLRILLKATANFRAVLISCRTQFFSKDEEIPKETGRIKIADRRAGQEAEYFFQKIYLSPFSDPQVKKYLRRKYPFWRKQRKLAFEVAKKIPHLTARPMLLAHIDDLLKSKREFRFSFELYEAMVEAWLKREKGYVKDVDALRSFSEMLAVDLYVTRAVRKSEKIPREGLLILAKAWNISIDDWKLSGRSLLNRDAEGNYKFAHRSIMEYLFIKRFLAGDIRTSSTDWTDQMHMFLYEHLVAFASAEDVTTMMRQSLDFMFHESRLKYFFNSLALGRERGEFLDQETFGRMAVLFIGSFLDANVSEASRVEWIHMREASNSSTSTVIAIQSFKVARVKDSFNNLIAIITYRSPKGSMYALDLAHDLDLPGHRNALSALMHHGLVPVKDRYTQSTSVRHFTFTLLTNKFMFQPKSPANLLKIVTPYTPSAESVREVLAMLIAIGRTDR